ncbi:MAG: hypothetical protein J5792_01975 [Bacteroidales bacterium]|nr:hypothetical protein [Bacteroidales bacterium]
MNIQQIICLLKAYFIENWKRDLWLFGITVLFAMLFPSFISTLMIVYIWLFAEKLWNPLHNPTAKMHFLTIPAGYREKTTAYLLLYNIYFIPVLVLSAFAGWGIMSLEPIQRVWFYHADFPKLIPLLSSMYIIGSTLFFGNIYFKKNASLKIIAAYILAFLLSVVLFIAVNILSDTMSFQFMFATPMMPNWHILGPVIILFFYFLSYLRLKETEA